MIHLVYLGPDFYLSEVCFPKLLSHHLRLQETMFFIFYASAYSMFLPLACWLA